MQGFTETMRNCVFPACNSLKFRKNAVHNSIRIFEI